MKTVLISCFHGYISRNLLLTDFLKELTNSPELRIVIIIPLNKIEYFEKNFASANVIIESVDFGTPSSSYFWSLLMKRASKYALNSESTRIEREVKLKIEKKYFYYLATTALAKAMSISKALRRLLRQLDYTFSPKDRFGKLLEKYGPDLVFVTDMLNERDVEVLHNAKKRRYRTLGMVRSWDNLTLHGLMRALPDYLMVHGPRLKQLAESLHDMPEDKIHVTGIPHYDNYVKEPEMKRKEFLSSIGFDPQKNTVMFAPISDHYLHNRDNDADPYVFDFLGSLPWQAIVRFSPSLTVTKLKDAKPYPNMYIDRPNIQFEDSGNELPKEADDNLKKEVYASDMLICGPSSVAMDAMAMGKPAIITAIHKNPKSYLEGIYRRYDYDHFKFLIECGAAKIVKTLEELKMQIEEYIKNPKLHEDERKKFLDAYCGPRDGNSGKRAAAAILEILKK